MLGSMRRLAILVVLAAGCARAGRTAGSAVVPQWSCDDGRVSCWNATREAPSPEFSNGELTCDWSCARYEGKTAALTMRVRPVYGYDLPYGWHRWACDAKPVGARPACEPR
jgi:hypothetical protein